MHERKALCSFSYCRDRRPRRSANLARRRDRRPRRSANLARRKIELTKHGQIADKYIRQLNDFYDDLSVEGYVIMPNHIHIMLWVKGTKNGPSRTPEANGPSRTPVPTVQNSVPSRFVSTLKRFCNKEYGINIWQYRSNDHIVRNRQDYEEHLRYI